MSDGVRLLTAYAGAALGAFVYVKLADGLTGWADVGVFAACIVLFAAPGVALTHRIEPGGLRR